MEKVRVGFIGVGGMAEAHIKTLQKIEQAQLTAVFDISAERAKQIQDTYGPKAYDSAEALLDSGEVDALFVCTPPFARGDIEEQAAKRGIAVLSEKPVGLDIEEARRKRDVIQQAGIINSTGYCLRYLDISKKAKDYLADKTIHLIMTYRLGGLPGVGWWPLQDKSGGQLTEQGTHQLDLVRYIAGDLTEVNAIQAQRHIRNVRPDATIADTVVISFKMESGALGSMTTSCMAKVGRGDVEVFGTDFYLSISGKTLKIIDANGTHTEESTVNYTDAQDRAFIEAVRTNDQSLILCDFADALVTLEATVAVSTAAETGKAVALAGRSL